MDYISATDVATQKESNVNQRDVLNVKDGIITQKNAQKNQTDAGTVPKTTEQAIAQRR